jgi:hypothetical protein
VPRADICSAANGIGYSIRFVGELLELASHDEAERLGGLDLDRSAWSSQAKSHLDGRASRTHHIALRQSPRHGDVP